MAYRFRKIRHSLRLIPATKSLGYSTRMNERDHSKAKVSTIEGISAYNKHEFQGHLNDTNSSPGTCHGQTVLPGALQIFDLPMPMTYKHPDAGIVSLSHFKHDVQHSFDDLELLMSAAKPVSFTCDDILPDSVSYHEQSTQSPLDSLWERASVSVDIMSSTHSQGYQKPVINMNPHVLSDSHTHSCSSISSDNNLPPHADDSDNFHGVFFSSSGNHGGKSSSQTPKDGPSAEQLHNARESIEKSIPQMFNGRYNFSILHKNVVLENNIFGSNKIKRGINAYALEMIKIRFRFYAKYTSTATEILNITTQEQNGTIRVHWRLKGLPQTQVLKFWRLFLNKDGIKKDDWEWFEAFSYFHIGKDGLVHKHRIDRMLPENEEPVSDKLSMRLTKLLNPAKPLVS